MNLPWVLTEEGLQAGLNVSSVKLINDLEATAYSISVLSETDFATIQPGGAEADGNAAVIAAGTGLGQAGLYWDGNRHCPFACEGGHSDFSPRNDLEAGLFEFLLKEFGYVEWERILSGPGLYNVYRYLCTKPNLKTSPSVAEELLQKDPASVISHAALENRCEVCVAALDLFISLYGAEAGNLALKMMATGGVYVAGGIAPKILKLMLDGRFANAFTEKGRLRRLLEPIPVRVILSDKAPLIGAAQCARIHHPV
jgi:glucokinase